jgi:hypothetical protein
VRGAKMVDDDRVGWFFVQNEQGFGVALGAEHAISVHLEEKSSNTQIVLELVNA